SFALTLDEAVEIWELRSNPPKKPKKEGRIDKRATGTSSGTGFAITKNGHIVTNSHVIGAAESIRVFVDGKWTVAELLANDKKNDLAIIKVDKPTLPLYLEQIAGPDLGDSMTVAGFPNPSIQGRSIKITKGTLSGLKGMADDIRHFQIDAAVQPGNSGGPLLDSTGAVVGIVNARLNDATVMKLTGSVPQNVNYAIKVDYLIPLIKTVKGLHQKLKGANAKDKLDFDKLEKSSVLLIEATTGSKK
ncbi:serine protease, partial [bacterium]|nr:serine protease [bacterium]